MPQIGHSAALPAAAQTVVDGPITEDTIVLKEKLTKAEALIRQREIEIADARDTHQRYKDATEARGSAPQTVPVKRAPVKYSFLRRRA